MRILSITVRSGIAAMISSLPPQFRLRFMRYHLRPQLRVRGQRALKADQLQTGPGDKGDLLARLLAWAANRASTPVA